MTSDGEHNQIEFDERDQRYQQFVVLFASHEPALHSFILSMLPNWSDADVVMQETSLVLWKKFDEFEPGSSFLNWGCQIARFEALNWRKKQSRDRHIFSDELTSVIADEGAEDLELHESQRRALEGCLRTLTDLDRDLVEQCYANGAVIKEIAQHSGRSPNALYKLLNRTRVKLMRCIERALATEGLQ